MMLKFWSNYCGSESVYQIARQRNFAGMQVRIVANIPTQKVHMVCDRILLALFIAEYLAKVWLAQLVAAAREAPAEFDI